MTALVFVGVLVGAYLYWLPGSDWFIGSLTIYVWAFLATLVTATVWAFIARQRKLIIAAVILWINFAGSHWGWTSADPVINQMVLDTVTAMLFVFIGTERWQFVIAFVYLLSVLAGLGELVGWIPGQGERPPVFIAWSFADITSICGHLASITLGLASGDWGRRVRITSSRPAFAGGSSLAGMVLRQRSTPLP